MKILDLIHSNIREFGSRNHGYRPNVLIMHYKSYFDLLQALGPVGAPRVTQTLTFEGMKIVRTQDIGEGEIEVGLILQ